MSLQRHNLRLLLTILTIVLALSVLLWNGQAFLDSAVEGGALLMTLALWEKEIDWGQALLGLALPVTVVVTWYVNALVIYLTPATMDSVLLRIDGGVSTWLYHWTRQHWQAHLLLFLVYTDLPLATAAVFLNNPRRMKAAGSLLLAAIVAALLFCVFPACGPAYLQKPHSARNCMPSLHVTWTLLLLWYASAEHRAILAIFALLTIASTLGLGEHYLLDLAAAFVFTALILYVQGDLPQVIPHRAGRALAEADSHAMDPADSLVVD